MLDFLYKRILDKYDSNYFFIKHIEGLSMSRMPVITRLYDSKPIVEKIPSHAWENKVTFNPACAFVEDRAELDQIIASLPISDPDKLLLRGQPGLAFLLYRAQGEKTSGYDYTRSCIGLAICSPELQPLVRLIKPVIIPDQPYELLGVEDARITKVGDTYVMFYTAYTTSNKENIVRIAIATTKNFVNWTKHGLLRGDCNTIDNKNAMLFEKKHNGKFVMLHRPMTGKDAMTIHWAESDDIFGEWNSRGCLMRTIENPAFVSTWIGGGAPPLHLSDSKYLAIYHIGNRLADGTREYDLGIALFDLDDQKIILKRDEPLMRPTMPSETSGDAQLGVNNVVFSCGAYFYKGDLYLPYQGSDTVILAAKITTDEITQYITH